MKRLYCCIAATLFSCMAPASVCHAQSEGEQIAAGILGVIGESIRAANNQQQRRQVPMRAAPSYDPNSSGPSNLQPNWSQGNGNRWTPSRPSNWSQGNGNAWTPARPSNVYRPPSHYNPTPSHSYSTPSYATSSSPSPPVAPAVTYSQKPIVVRCPKSEYGIVSYVLTSENGNYNYTMTPGHKQTFKENAAWVIKYDRGNGGGVQEYRLRGGKEYKLVRDDEGYWQLYAERS